MSSLNNVIKTLDSMVSSEVLGDYAVGGAFASLFYIEATRTYDVDIFAVIPRQSGTLIDLSAIYQWCSANNLSFEREHILMHGTPVQILSANEGLENEAVKTAILHDYNNAKIKVMKPEYLVALYSKAGGNKRRERIQMLRELPNFDDDLLTDITTRYELVL